MVIRQIILYLTFVPHVPMIRTLDQRINILFYNIIALLVAKHLEQRILIRIKRNIVISVSVKNDARFFGKDIFLNSSLLLLNHRFYHTITATIQAGQKTFVSCQNQ